MINLQMEQKRLSITYKILRSLGFNYSEEEYGQVSLCGAVHKMYKIYRNMFLLKFVMNAWILSPILHRKVRPWALRKMGCSVGKNVFIGDGAKIMPGITIGEGAVIGSNAVVTHDVEAYSVVAGVPAVRIK